MQSSEFIKSLNFESNLKKLHKKPNIFHLKIDLYRKKYFQKFEIEHILIDLSYVFPVKPSEFKISILVKRYDDKTAENYRNDYVAEI